jgi:type VI secretion system protein ImpG
MLPSDDLLRRYVDELTYLRESGQQFARAHPKIAARLELHRGESSDPHVERLIESFAFLTARIQQGLANDFPEVASELLDVLYPHYLRPIPSMGIARFAYGPQVRKMTSAYVVPRDKSLFAIGKLRDTVCRMRTCYPLELWPIDVSDASVSATHDAIRVTRHGAVIRIVLQSQGEPFEKLELDRLRFYLHGEPVATSNLYELLMTAVSSVTVRSGDETVATFDPPNIAVVGFDEEEALIPYPRQSHPAYRLLQEYFAFPEKFQFVDFTGLRGRLRGKTATFIIQLDRVVDQRITVNKDTFMLGCTPIVNLFTRTSDPIRIDHQRLEYPLTADVRRDRTTEVHSIVSVSGAAVSDDASRDYAPFYGLTHAMRGPKAYWHARRVRSNTSAGTDMYLSFVDRQFDPLMPPDELVYARVLCTNRELAAELPVNAELQSDESMPASAFCLTKPTRPIDPPLGGQTLWRLVSQLSLNYLSLSDAAQSLEAFKDILRLHCFSESNADLDQIDGIRSLTQRKIMRPAPSWRGFCRGTEIRLVLDDVKFVGRSAFLFASVLNQFFALHATINSFTQLVVTRAGRESETWKPWPIMVGGKPVL